MSYIPAMSIAEQILAEVAHLSVGRQAEVLDFAGYLRSREAATQDEDWKRLSMNLAMRGLEDEPDLYQVSDIKETVQ